MHIWKLFSIFCSLLWLFNLFFRLSPQQPIASNSNAQQVPIREIVLPPGLNEECPSQHCELPEQRIASNSNVQQFPISKTDVPSDLNKERPSQPRLKTYPRRKIGDRFRSSDQSWYTNGDWLEYSILWDSRFCFPCRIFHTNNKLNPFTSGGFDNWKSALETSKGFDPHKLSQQHDFAYASWREKEKKESTGAIIANSWKKWKQIS